MQVLCRNSEDLTSEAINNQKGGVGPSLTASLAARLRPISPYRTTESGSISRTKLSAACLVFPVHRP